MPLNKSKIIASIEAEGFSTSTTGNVISFDGMKLAFLVDDDSHLTGLTLSKVGDEDPLVQAWATKFALLLSDEPHDLVKPQVDEVFKSMSRNKPVGKRFGNWMFSLERHSSGSEVRIHRKTNN